MMLSEKKDNQKQLKGHVKWFDPLKGFGFILTELDGGDVLLHANVLRNFGQSSIADESEITIIAQETDRGWQALEILEVVPPESESFPLKDMYDISIEDLESAQILPARVKWFDKMKGFGFANAFGDDSDVFIHIEVLRRSGLSDLQPGEAVGLRKIGGDRGLLAIDIVSWDNVRIE